MKKQDLSKTLCYIMLVVSFMTFVLLCYRFAAESIGWGSDLATNPPKGIV